MHARHNPKLLEEGQSSATSVATGTSVHVAGTFLPAAFDASAGGAGDSESDGEKPLFCEDLYRTFAHHEVPSRCVYDHVLSGYRGRLSLARCVRTLFAWHTETLNVWIHLVGVLVFVALSSRTLYRHYVADDFFVADYLMFGLFFFCTTLCFLCSSLYHLFLCSSRRLAVLLLRLDMLGVILHIGFNFVIGHWYFWYCSRLLQRIYLSTIPPMYAAGVLLPMLDCFLSPRRRRLRMFLFVILGVVCAVPVVHWAWIHADVSWAPPFLRDMIRTLCAYFGAVFLYFARIPERFAPGRFDLCGQSHQLWHLLSLLGALSFYDVLVDMHALRVAQACLA